MYHSCRAACAFVPFSAFKIHPQISGSYPPGNRVTQAGVTSVWMAAIRDLWVPSAPALGVFPSQARLGWKGCLSFPQILHVLEGKQRNKEGKFQIICDFSVVGTSFLVVCQAGLTSLVISTPNPSSFPADSKHQSQSFCLAAAGFIFCPLPFAMGGKTD